MAITKEQFENVYNKYLPNKFIKFVFKHYAYDTEETSGVNLKLADKIAWYVLFPLVLLGILFTIFKVPKPIIGAVAIPFSIIMIILVLTGFVGVIMNNLRIRKIRKELGLSVFAYNKLAKSFG